LAIPGADAFFPDFDVAEWRKIGEYPLRVAGPVAVAHEWLRL
jgi:dihydrofolate reductase